MEDQYAMADLRQFISGRPLYAPISPPPDLLSSHCDLNPPHPYNMLVFRSDSTNISVATANTSAGGASSSAATGDGFRGFEMEGGGVNCGGGRWPRQETLTLLEIRSRLDPKFKEANQKGPLWDEVSRIMSEEHGYQRSSKKCREKFENLYKYYKKTKEGKAGRQDGKHYRFFRQLEALYGDANNSAPLSETHLVGRYFNHDFPNKHTTSLANNDQEYFPGSKLSDTSLGLISDSHATSSDDSDHNEGINDNDLKKKKRSKKSFKLKVKDFIDAQMRKLMDKQEAWMEKMMRTIEHKEQERMLREEEWRKQDAARIEMEHKFWASERAWIEARDASLMDTFQKLTGKVSRASPPEQLMAAEIRSLSENLNDDGSDQTMNNPVKGEIWPEGEISRLIQLRNAMELKFQHRGGISEEVLREEIATDMVCFGHDRSALMCKEKWDSVNNYALKCSKKRKENLKGCTNYQNHEAICSGGSGAYCHASEQGVNQTIRINDHGNSPHNSNTGNPISDSCFRYFMGDEYGRIID